MLPDPEPVTTLTDRTQQEGYCVGVWSQALRDWDPLLTVCYSACSWSLETPFEMSRCPTGESFALLVVPAKVR